MTFTGRATYDTQVFEGIEEDVSQLISMVTPHETPTLDALAQAERPAISTLHEWHEEELVPDTCVASVTAGSAVTTLTIGLNKSGGGSVTGFLLPGIQMVTPSGEYLQVTAIVGDIVTITRGFGSTTAATITAGNVIEIIGDAALEGDDVSKDLSRGRPRQTNYLQLMKKDIIISGTEMAVSHIGVSNEFDHQVQNRLKELLRDLNQTVLRGRSSGATIGSSTQRRTMTGLLQFLSTNVATSIATLTADVVDGIVELAWNNGGTDLDLIICDNVLKRQFDALQSSRIQVPNMESTYRNKVTYYEGTYGTQRVIMDRWMPASTMVVISSQRVRVVPLQNRSFRFVPVARTGDAVKGMLVGEYTLMVRNENAMVQAYA